MMVVLEVRVMYYRRDGTTPIRSLLRREANIIAALHSGCAYIRFALVASDFCCFHESLINLTYFSEKTSRCFSGVSVIFSPEISIE